MPLFLKYTEHEPYAFISFTTSGYMLQGLHDKIQGTSLPPAKNLIDFLTNLS